MAYSGFIRSVVLYGLLLMPFSLFPIIPIPDHFSSANLQLNPLRRRLPFCVRGLLPACQHFTELNWSENT
jgi:hypothetical protein